MTLLALDKRRERGGIHEIDHEGGVDLVAVLEGPAQQLPGLAVPGERQRSNFIMSTPAMQDVIRDHWGPVEQN